DASLTIASVPLVGHPGGRSPGWGGAPSVARAGSLSLDPCPRPCPGLPRPASAVRCGRRTAGGRPEVSEERLRLMAVHAHPDDESSKGAATMALYAAQGVDVLVVTCTDGARGSVLNQHYSGPEPVGLDGMRQVR